MTGNFMAVSMAGLCMLLTSQVHAGPRDDAEALMAEYTWAVDRRELQELAGLFTDTGALELPVIAGVFLGREAITEFFAGAWEPIAAAEEQRRHVISNVRVLEDSPHRIEFTAYMTIFASRPSSPPVLRMLGFYEAAAVHVGGRWRLQLLRINVDGSASD